MDIQKVLKLQERIYKKALSLAPNYSKCDILGWCLEDYKKSTYVVVNFGGGKGWDIVAENSVNFKFSDIDSNESNSKQVTIHYTVKRKSKRSPKVITLHEETIGAYVEIGKIHCLSTIDEIDRIKQWIEEKGGDFNNTKLVKTN